MKEIDHIFTPYVHERNTLPRYQFPHLKWADGAGRVWASVDRGVGRSPHRPAATLPPNPHPPPAAPLLLDSAQFVPVDRFGWVLPGGKLVNGRRRTESNSQVLVVILEQATAG